MAEDIIIRYRAETDEFLKELNVLIDKQDQLADEAEKTAKSFDKSATNEVQAAKRRQQAIEAELKNIERLKQARARAFDPVLIDRFNRQISESEKRIKSLGSAVDKAGKETVSAFNSAGSQIKNIGLGIAAGFGAAFAVDAIIGSIRNLATAASNAFLEAEENANRLKFAITQVNGESEATFDKLIKQSSELQSISIFSDDDIQKAQTALAQFGLTGQQVEELIPKIVDLASANKIDLAQATEASIRALEGQTRGLTTLGVKFDDTGSRVGNYNKFIEQTAKFTGATQEATTTLTGSLEQAKNEIDDIAELVGSGLAPVFAKAKLVFLDFAKTVLENIGLIKKETVTESDFKRQADIITAEVQGQVDAYVKLGLSELDAREKVIKKLQERTSAELSFAIEERDADAVKRLNNELATLSVLLGDVISKRQQDERILDSNKLRGKSIADLNALLIENQKINDVIAKDNIDLINKELELRKKAAEEARKAAEEAIKKEQEARKKAYEDAVKQAIEFQKIIEKSANIEIQFEFQNILNEEGPVQAIEFVRNKFGKQLQAELLRLQNEINSNPLNIGLTDTEKNALALEQFQKYVDDLNAKFKEAGIDINATSEDITDVIGEDFLNLPFEDALRLLQTAYQRYFPGFVTTSKNATNEATNNLKDYADTWLGKNELLLRSSLDLFSQLSELSSAFTQQRIDDLNLQLEKVREVEEAQLTALEESKEKRLISDADFEKRSAAIKQQRLESEKKLQAEIKKQRQKQANLEKANAIFEIALSTAMAVAAALRNPPSPNIPLAALAGALGAAQLAAVFARPVPQFAKGTKGKKGSGMALVGEQGAEMTFLPDGAKVLPAKQTKTYGEVFDAMYDNRFEKYVMQKYVAPALEEQKRKYEGRKQESFASNIVSSMQYNGITTSDLLYANSKGTKVKNADEIAQAIAKALKTQSPDLWRM